MKQKRINDILYVYSLEPYHITSDTDASIIFVQEELYQEYKALNPSLTQLAKKNYKIFTVNTPEWYVEEDDDLESPYLLNMSPALMNNVSINTSTNTIETDTSVGTLKLFKKYSNNTDVLFSSSNTDVADAFSDGSVLVKDEGETSLVVEYNGDESFESVYDVYSLLVTEGDISLLDPEISFSLSEITAYYQEESSISYPSLINPHNVTIIYSTDDESVINVNPSTGVITSILKEYETFGSSTYPAYANIYATFVGNDTYKAKQISYKVNISRRRGELNIYWSQQSCEATILEENTYPQIVNIEDVPQDSTITYQSSDTSKATINQQGEITLIEDTGEGNITISAIFSGNSTFKPKTISYSLKINEAINYLPSWAILETENPSLLDFVDPAKSKPSTIEIIDCTDLEKPTQKFLWLPKSWIEYNNNGTIIRKPIITDASNDLQMALEFNPEDYNSITVENVEYVSMGVLLGCGTFTIEF